MICVHVTLFTAIFVYRLQCLFFIFYIMPDMETGSLLLVLLTIYQVSSLKCYSCDSEKQPELCSLCGERFPGDDQIVECNGTCKIGYLSGNSDTVLLRMCENNLQTGCDRKPEGYLCQCSVDFCNYSLKTCHIESRCKYPLSWVMKYCP